MLKITPVGHALTRFAAQVLYRAYAKGTPYSERHRKIQQQQTESSSGD